jgi:hypothetical protein
LLILKSSRFWNAFATAKETLGIRSRYLRLPGRRISHRPGHRTIEPDFAMVYSSVRERRFAAQIVSGVAPSRLGRGLAYSFEIDVVRYDNATKAAVYRC